MKYDIVITNQCKKDIKKASKQGKNIDLLFEIIDKLSEGEPLDSKYRDHKLSGQYEEKESVTSNQISYLFIKYYKKKLCYIL